MREWQGRGRVILPTTEKGMLGRSPWRCLEDQPFKRNKLVLGVQDKIQVTDSKWSEPKKGNLGRTEFYPKGCEKVVP